MRPSASWNSWRIDGTTPSTVGNATVSVCLSVRRTNPPAVPGQASLGGRGTTLDFDPVITVPLNFQTGDPDPSHNYVLCPGTELNFVEATTLPNASLVLDQKQVTLDAFAARFADKTPRPQGPPQPEPEPQ